MLHLNKNTINSKAGWRQSLLTPAITPGDGDWHIFIDVRNAAGQVCLITWNVSMCCVGLFNVCGHAQRGEVALISLGTFRTKHKQKMDICGGPWLVVLLWVELADWSCCYEWSPLIGRVAMSVALWLVMLSFMELSDWSCCNLWSSLDWSCCYECSSLIGCAVMSVALWLVVLLSSSAAGEDRPQRVQTRIRREIWCVEPGDHTGEFTLSDSD